MNPSIVQNKVIFLSVSASCLFNQTLSSKHFVQYLWHHFRFTSYVGYMCLCPPAYLSTPSLLVDMLYSLSRDWHFILVSEKWCCWFRDRLQFVGDVWSVFPSKETPLYLVMLTLLMCSHTHCSMYWCRVSIAEYKYNPFYIKLFFFIVVISYKWHCFHTELVTCQYKRTYKALDLESHWLHYPLTLLCLSKQVPSK